MSVTIERFEVKNRTLPNGTTKELATFSANLGGITINGCSIMEHGDNRWVSFPGRRYQNAQGEWKDFHYVWFGEGRGEQIRNKIIELAMEELSRRGVEAPTPAAGDGEEDWPF
jgi:hypothetical protein